MNTRILGAEGYGYLTVIIAATTLVHGLAALPGGETVMTFATRSVAEGRRDEAGSVFRFTVVLSIGMALVAYAVIAVLALTARDLIGIGEGHVTAMLLYGLVGVFVATMAENQAVLRLADRMSVALAVTLAATLTRVALVALAWWNGGGLSAVVKAYVAAAAVNGIGLFVAAAAAAPKAGMTGFLTSFSIKVPSQVVAFQTGVFGKAHRRKETKRDLDTSGRNAAPPMRRSRPAFSIRRHRRPTESRRRFWLWSSPGNSPFLSTVWRCPTSGF